MTIKTVRDLIPRFRSVKLWLYANDSTKKKLPSVLVSGMDGYQIEAIYPQCLDFEVINFDMGENGLNIFIEYPVPEIQFVDTRKNAILGIFDNYITKDMVCKGLERGYIKLVNNSDVCSNTVCQIGEFWFYFGGNTAEELLPEEYLRDIPFDTIVDEIHQVLDAFRKDWDDFGDEYMYYEAFLSDKLLNEDNQVNRR